MFVCYGREVGMRRILVTGGAGFIGSNFVRHAIGLGNNIIVLDSLEYSGNRAKIRRLAGWHLRVVNQGDHENDHHDADYSGPQSSQDLHVFSLVHNVHEPPAERVNPARVEFSSVAPVLRMLPRQQPNEHFFSVRRSYKRDILFWDIPKGDIA